MEVVVVTKTCKAQIKMSPSTNQHPVFIVTMALSRVVSEIFNVKKCCDLEIQVRGHSRSLKVVPFDRLLMVSY